MPDPTQTLNVTVAVHPANTAEKLKWAVDELNEMVDGRWAMGDIAEEDYDNLLSAIVIMHSVAAVLEAAEDWRRTN